MARLLNTVGSGRLTKSSSPSRNNVMRRLAKQALPYSGSSLNGTNKQYSWQCLPEKNLTAKNGDYTRRSFPSGNFYTLSVTVFPPLKCTTSGCPWSRLQRSEVGRDPTHNRLVASQAAACTRLWSHRTPRAACFLFLKQIYSNGRASSLAVIFPCQMCASVFASGRALRNEKTRPCNVGRIA